MVRIIMSSWRVNPFIILECLFLPHIILLVLKSSLSEIKVVTIGINMVYVSPSFYFNLRLYI